MFKRLVFVILLMLGTVELSSAQEGGPAQLRVMQLSFFKTNVTTYASSTVNVRIGDTLIFENISYPFTTEYVEVSPGSHVFSATIAGYDDAIAATMLNLESDHSYSLIVEGNYSTHSVRFIVVDETHLPLDEMGSVAIMVNLTQAAIDIYFAGQAVFENLPVGQYGFMSLPQTTFAAAITPTGDPNMVIYSSDFVPLPHTIFLDAVLPADNGALQVVNHRSSPLTISEYLRSPNDQTPFASIAELINKTDLLDSVTDDSEFTLFLPTNEALVGLSRDTIPTDTDQLRAFLANHVIPGSLPPYLLPNHEALTTLENQTVSLNFANTNSGYWEIAGAPIWWDVQLKNGVIYAIDGVIVP